VCATLNTELKAISNLPFDLMVAGVHLHVMLLLGLKLSMLMSDVSWLAAP
jgi:hypothetical protein